MSTHPRRRSSAGQASLIVIVGSMLLVAVLVALYMRSAGQQGAKDGPAASALDAAKRQAASFEDQQQKRLQEMDRQTADQTAK